ncbi:MAG: hypothetical protein H6966_00010 [Chromatiaceae bacterium]|nr:hypothetical protein [Chromatiaceae bacterium]
MPHSFSGRGDPVGIDATTIKVRIILKAFSVFLGVMFIYVTLAGQVEYRGLDAPWLNLIFGIALIVTPLDALAFLLAYFLMVVPIIAGGILGGAFGARLLGKPGVILGFIGGLIAGGGVLVKTPYCDWVGGLHRAVKGKDDD